MTIERLKMYKTAFSPIFNQFVGITKVHEDEDGQPIIHAYLAFDENKHSIMFREHELTRFTF